MFVRLLLYHLIVEVSVVSSQAPGDEDTMCVTGANAQSYPADWRVLLDSRNYENLLEGPSPVWRTVDVDEQGQGWRRTLPGGNCMRRVRSCDFNLGQGQQNWLFTQLVSYEMATRLTVETTFDLSECENQPNCQNLHFDLYRFEPSGGENDASAISPSNYQFLSRLDQANGVSEGTQTRFFTRGANKTAFHLAFRDLGTCVSVNRFIVYYEVCPLQEFPASFIRYPVIALPMEGSVAQTRAECTVENMAVIGNPLLACYSNGSYVPEGGAVLQCACGPGYTFNSTLSACQGCLEGHYKSAISNSDQCLPCPANSLAPSPASSECPCQKGFVRQSPAVVDQQCLDLDPPRSLRDASNSSSTQICWLPSLDALSFNLSYGIYLREALTDCFIKLGDLNDVSTSALTVERCYSLDNAAELENGSGGDLELLVTVHFEASLNPSKLFNLSEVEERSDRVNVTERSMMEERNPGSRSGVVTAVVVVVVIIVLLVLAVILVFFLRPLYKMRSSDEKNIEDGTNHKELSQTGSSKEKRVHATNISASKDDDDCQAVSGPPSCSTPSRSNFSSPQSEHQPASNMTEGLQCANLNVSAISEGQPGDEPQLTQVGDCSSTAHCPQSAASGNSSSGFYTPQSSVHYSTQ